MTAPDLRGMGVALVTPFHRDKTIDYEALGRLIDYQVEGGADFFVALGTTAETPTLNADERRRVREFVVEKVGGRKPVVLGCGGNNTHAVIDELKSVDLDPFAALLSVVPCYNKPSQEGLYQHFSAIADECPKPMLLYNVPGRTGVNMTAETTLRLAYDHSNIVGIKEASGNFTQIDSIIKAKPSTFQVLSGDDGITFPLITLGCGGVVSVIGNAFPREFARMVKLALAGNLGEARAIHYRFVELFSLLFVDGNPAGVKCALHYMGLIDNELRLPLVPTRITTRDSITRIIDSIRQE